MVGDRNCRLVGDRNYRVVGNRNSRVVWEEEAGALGKFPCGSIVQIHPFYESYESFYQSLSSVSVLACFR